MEAHFIRDRKVNVMMCRHGNGAFNGPCDKCEIIELKAERDAAHAALAESQRMHAELQTCVEDHAKSIFGQENERLKAALAEAQMENERICTLHKGLMANADERAERAESALVAAERDAARYQWLRANEGTDDGGILVVDAACDHCDYIGMEVLDAAIDAALSSTGEGNGG